MNIFAKWHSDRIRVPYVLLRELSLGQPPGISPLVAGVWDSLPENQGALFLLEVAEL